MRSFDIQPYLLDTNSLGFRVDERDLGTVRGSHVLALYSDETTRVRIHDFSDDNTKWKIYAVHGDGHEWKDGHSYVYYDFKPSFNDTDIEVHAFTSSHLKPIQQGLLISFKRQASLALPGSPLAVTPPSERDELLQQYILADGRSTIIPIRVYIPGDVGEYELSLFADLPEHIGGRVVLESPPVFGSLWLEWWVKFEGDAYEAYTRLLSFLSEPINLQRSYRRAEKETAYGPAHELAHYKIKEQIAKARRAEIEAQRAEIEAQRAEIEAQRAELELEYSRLEIIKKIDGTSSMVMQVSTRIVKLSVGTTEKFEVKSVREFEKDQDKVHSIFKAASQGSTEVPPVILEEFLTPIRTGEEPEPSQCRFSENSPNDAEEPRLEPAPEHQAPLRFRTALIAVLGLILMTAIATFVSSC